LLLMNRHFPFFFFTIKINLLFIHWVTKKIMLKSSMDINQRNDCTSIVIIKNIDVFKNLKGPLQRPWPLILQIILMIFLISMPLKWTGLSQKLRNILNEQLSHYVVIVWH
jgi:hypothetical protein